MSKTTKKVRFNFLPACAFCERRQGDMTDVAGFPAPNSVPLGPVEPCGRCGRMACPDCEHEGDCCGMGCLHDRLNMEGVCRACGKDCRGIG